MKRVAILWVLSLVVFVIAGCVSVPTDSTTPKPPYFGDPLANVDNEFYLTNTNGYDVYTVYGNAYINGFIDTNSNVVTCFVNGLGSETYNPKVIFPGYTNLIDGSNYTVVFYARANKAKTVNVNVGQSVSAADNYWYDETNKHMVVAAVQPFLTGAFSQYTMKFTKVNSKATNVQPVIELGTIDGDATLCVIQFSNVIISND
jgi:hypothetical protein